MSPSPTADGECTSPSLPLVIADGQVLALYNVNTYATKRIRRIVGVLLPICQCFGSHSDRTDE
jgi:hypothetical protein